MIREAVELVLQELIEAEAAEAIDAGRYERSDARTTHRNGHRPRLLATQAGIWISRRRPSQRDPALIHAARRARRLCHGCDGQR